MSDVVALDFRDWVVGMGVVGVGQSLYKSPRTCCFRGYTLL